MSEVLNIRAAALWMIGAIVSFSLMALAGREMASNLDTFEIMLYRSVIGVVIMGAVGAATERLHEARTRRPGLHLARNIAHFTGQNLWFYALATIPLAQVVAFEFTTPIWVAVLAPLFLGERMSHTRLMAIGLGFLGVLVVARPGLAPLGAGHFSAMACALGFAGTYMATSRLTRTESLFGILFWMTVMQAIFGLVCAGFDGDIALPEPSNYIWIIVVALGGLTAHTCITAALQRARATTVSPIDFIRLPAIAVLGAVIYREPLELVVFLGAALIFIGNFINLRAATRQRTPKIRTMV